MFERIDRVQTNAACAALHTNFQCTDDIVICSDHTPNTVKKGKEEEEDDILICSDLVQLCIRISNTLNKGKEEEDIFGSMRCG